MTTFKALIWSLGIAVISVVLISISKMSVPPKGWVLKEGLTFFVTAFVMFRFFLFKKGED